MVEVLRVNAAEFNEPVELLSLLRQAFAYMEGRVDPPSSLNTFDVEKLIKKVRDEILFIAVKDKKLVGCVFARPCMNYVYLGKLAVKPDYRGLGISRLLVSQVEACTNQLGIPEVEIETRVELVENQALFEYLGYRKTAEKSHQGYDYPTSYCYRKNLVGSNL